MGKASKEMATKHPSIKERHDSLSLIISGFFVDLLRTAATAPLQGLIILARHLRAEEAETIQKSLFGIMSVPEALLWIFM